MAEIISSRSPHEKWKIEPMPPVVGGPWNLYDLVVTDDTGLVYHRQGELRERVRPLYRQANGRGAN